MAEVPLPGETSHKHRYHPDSNPDLEVCSELVNPLCYQSDTGVYKELKYSTRMLRPGFDNGVDLTYA